MPATSGSIRSFSASREAGLFNPNNFFDQIAIAGGVGLRFDFTFFIIRLDGGMKFKNPAHPTGDRWVLDEQKLRDITFNFGIGYPF